MPSPRISAISPLWAIAGGRVAILGEGLLPDPDALPSIRIGDAEARVVRASNAEIQVIVPEGVEGRVPVRVDAVSGATAFIDVGATLATGLHMVDSPVYDRRGAVYGAFSGTRSQQAAVTIYRVYAGRPREPFVSTIAHPTSMAVGPDGLLYVTDRFEGTLYRVREDGQADAVATGLGVPFGIAFAPDGSTLVGDRSGPIYRLDEKGFRTTVATLPASVAAFHLAWGPDDCLYVAAPSLETRDPVYCVSLDGKVETLPVLFGRPQGLAFDRQGRLYVCEALAGRSGIYRMSVREEPAPELVLSAAAVVGLCFDPAGGLVVTSGEALYQLAVAI